MATPEETAAAAAKTAADEAAAKQAEETKNKEFAPVPYSRFSEVNEEKKALEKKLQEKEAAEKADTEKRLIEQQEFQKLADTRGKELADLQPKAAKADALEKTLQTVLDSQIADIPEDKRGLIPEKLSTQDKLEWLAKNAAILKAPGSFDIGAGKVGADGKQSKPLEPGEIETAARFGMSAEEYVKYQNPHYSKTQEVKK